MHSYSQSRFKKSLEPHNGLNNKASHKTLPIAKISTNLVNVSRLGSLRGKFSLTNRYNFQSNKQNVDTSNTNFHSTQSSKQLHHHFNSLKNDIYYPHNHNRNHHNNQKQYYLNFKNNKKTPCQYQNGDQNQDEVEKYFSQNNFDDLLVEEGLGLFEKNKYQQEIEDKQSNKPMKQMIQKQNNKNLVDEVCYIKERNGSNSIFNINKKNINDDNDKNYLKKDHSKDNLSMLKAKRQISSNCHSNLLQEKVKSIQQKIVRKSTKPIYDYNMNQFLQIQPVDQKIFRIQHSNNLNNPNHDNVDNRSQMHNRSSINLDNNADNNNDQRNKKIKNIAQLSDSQMIMQDKQNNFSVNNRLSNNKQNSSNNIKTNQNKNLNIEGKTVKNYKIDNNEKTNTINKITTKPVSNCELPLQQKTKFQQKNVQENVKYSNIRVEQPSNHTKQSIKNFNNKKNKKILQSSQRNNSVDLPNNKTIINNLQKIPSINSQQYKPNSKFNINNHQNPNAQIEKQTIKHTIYSVIKIISLIQKQQQQAIQKQSNINENENCNLGKKSHLNTNTHWSSNPDNHPNYNPNTNLNRIPYNVPRTQPQIIVKTIKQQLCKLYKNHLHMHIDQLHIRQELINQINRQQKAQQKINYNYKKDDIKVKQMKVKSEKINVTDSNNQNNLKNTKKSTTKLNHIPTNSYSLNTDYHQDSMQQAQVQTQIFQKYELKQLTTQSNQPQNYSIWQFKQQNTSRQYEQDQENIYQENDINYDNHYSGKYQQVMFQTIGSGRNLLDTFNNNDLTSQLKRVNGELADSGENREINERKNKVNQIEFNRLKMDIQRSYAEMMEQAQINKNDDQKQQDTNIKRIKQCFQYRNQIDDQKQDDNYGYTLQQEYYQQKKPQIMRKLFSSSSKQQNRVNSLNKVNISKKNINNQLSSYQNQKQRNNQHQNSQSVQQQSRQQYNPQQLQQCQQDRQQSYSINNANNNNQLIPQHYYIVLPFNGRDSSTNINKNSHLQKRAIQQKNMSQMPSNYSSSTSNTRNYLNLKDGDVIKLLKKVKQQLWIAEFQDQIAFINEEVIKRLKGVNRNCRQ